MRKIIVVLLAALLVFNLYACGGSSAGTGDTASNPSASSGTGSANEGSGAGSSAGSSDIARPSAGAPAHERLFYEVRQMTETARQQGDAGYSLVEEYLLGMAQAEISSLRQCADTTLWLRGEGANLAEVIANAPYADWDAIVGAGPGSDAPFYFEGLLLTFQGKDSEAQACYLHHLAALIFTVR